MSNTDEIFFGWGGGLVEEEVPDLLRSVALDS